MGLYTCGFKSMVDNERYLIIEAQDDFEAQFDSKAYLSKLAQSGHN